MIAKIPDLVHNCRINDLGPLLVPDPEFGDLRLAVFPFSHDGQTPIRLPEGFGCWEETLREIMNRVPVQAGAVQFFVTIDTKFFTTPGYLRREGVHMDGNFCADPTFRYVSWGGGNPPPKETWHGDRQNGPPPKETWFGKETWGAANGRPQGLLAVGTEEKPDNSHVRMGFTLPYDLIIPLGKYVSGSLGGTLVASSYEGCQAWPGTYYGEVGAGGDWSAMLDQLGGAVPITANRLWFMSSNCPHETLPIPEGVRRTFIRVTFPHNYDNRAIGRHY